MPRLLRKHRQILYQLKRDWGLSVQIFRPTSASHDVTTGEIARTFEVHSVKDAPVLPKHKKREFVYDLAYIAAGKNFTEGAFFDKGQRQVIIEQRDLPKGFEPNLDDFVVFNFEKHEIKEVEVAEEFAAFRLMITSIDNQKRVKWVAVKNKITPLSSVAVE